ncbi:uncharacterized protein MYCFIDRAFT_209140 [Pseudocercospora fijiensis CIRAD86]|uniref:Uncharacterized protein n=1 Tax=Pseudocercospora fijiensis (strain CIRAD86) TaxID=383855 RepID=M2YIP3_PSEFD|nr:uncharacterized protein MYCFIDRAFT_209140 [Pseudocercospora fijiensis CIRAD86]EME77635.1 hypothetical protein MYCFIDRAFT_209140 [Pseudocercospora fijiensis CIRAD86]
MEGEIDLQTCCPQRYSKGGLCEQGGAAEGRCRRKGDRVVVVVVSRERIGASRVTELELVAVAAVLDSGLLLAVRYRAEESGGGGGGGDAGEGEDSERSGPTNNTYTHATRRPDASTKEQRDGRLSLLFHSQSRRQNDAILEAYKAEGISCSAVEFSSTADLRACAVAWKSPSNGAWTIFHVAYQTLIWRYALVLQSCSTVRSHDASEPYCIYPHLVLDISLGDMELARAKIEVCIREGMEEESFRFEVRCEWLQEVSEGSEAMRRPRGMGHACHRHVYERCGPCRILSSMATANQEGPEVKNQSSAIDEHEDKAPEIPLRSNAYIMISSMLLPTTKASRYEMHSNMHASPNLSNNDRSNTALTKMPQDGTSIHNLPTTPPSLHTLQLPHELFMQSLTPTPSTSHFLHSHQCFFSRKE